MRLHRRVFHRHVLTECRRVARVAGEHFVMRGNDEPRLQRTRQVCGFLVGHIPNDPRRQPVRIAAVDREQHHIELPAAQFGLQAFVPDRVARVIERATIGFEDQSQIRVATADRILVQELV